MLKNFIPKSDWELVNQLFLINSTKELIVVVLEELSDFNV